MQKIIKIIIKVNRLTKFSFLIFITSLTTFSSIQAQSEQVVKSPAVIILNNLVTEQQEIAFDKFILQEETKFDNPIVNNEQALDVNKYLELYDWQLKNAVDSQNKIIIVLTTNPDPVVLKFTSNKVNEEKYQSVDFSVGCNSMSGSYQIKENQLFVNAVMSTKKYCEDMDAAETKLAKLMEDKSQILLQNETLYQTAEDGSTLTWQGVLTNDSEYGKGETIFLEIAPQSEFCSSGINQQCLKVRDVFYNDNWTRLGTSDWRLMKQPINGYNHDPKYSKLLRLKKYISNPVDIKGKQLIYVLDMVVESTVTK